MKVYLAGPDVFLPDAKDIGRRKKEICARWGLAGLFPLDSDVVANEIGEEPGAGAPLSVRIFRSCIAMMEDADAVIAHLTPFRGPSADAGTVFELGYMAARGKICTGYTNRGDSYADRVARVVAAGAGDVGAGEVEVGRLLGVASGADGLASLDREGHLIENFGLTDNLMIVHALDTFGCPILAPAAAPADIWRDLTLFEKCAEWIAQRARN
jgi:nucleoside 2-deoxyribosyltransferase